MNKIQSSGQFGWGSKNWKVQFSSCKNFKTMVQSSNCWNKFLHWSSPQDHKITYSNKPENRLNIVRVPIKPCSEIFTCSFSLANIMGCVQSKSKPNEQHTNSSKGKDKQNGVSNSSKVGHIFFSILLFFSSLSLISMFHWFTLWLLITKFNESCFKKCFI